MIKIISKLGPGLLFAGAAIGVSHLVQSTRAGAEFGWGLIWALILVNIIAEVGEYFTGIHIHMLLRIALILGVTMGAFVMSGAITLVNEMDKEVPLSSNAKNTLGSDKNEPKKS